MNVMIPNTFSDKIAQREELSAAYARIDELETVLRTVRGVLASEGFHDDPDDWVCVIDDVLEPVVIAPDEAFAAVFLNGC